MTKHKLAVVGCGGIVRGQHLPAYQRLSGVAEVVAACDPNEQALAAVRERFGVPQLYARLDEFLKHSDADIVTVATPPAQREEVIVPILESGRHVLVGKPFTHRLPEAQRIVAAAQKVGVTLAVNQNFRWKAITQKAKELIDAGTLGDVSFLGETFFVWRNEKGGWRSTTPQLEISVYSIHLLDRIRYLCAKKVTTVHCATLTSPVLASKGESLSCTTVTFEGGIIGQCNSSWCARGLSQNEFRVDGTHGSLRGVGDKQMEVFIVPTGCRRYDEGAEREGTQQSFPFDADFTGTFAHSMRLLIEAIDAGREPPHSGRDNLETMAIVDAAYRSAEERCVVTL